MASSRAERYCVCLEVREGVSYEIWGSDKEGGFLGNRKSILDKSGAVVTVSQINPFPQATSMAAEKNACSESLSPLIRLGSRIYFTGYPQG
ncbi:MAG: hypothetical protein C4291_02860 [Candidatus Dadabacteria bacterium]